MGVNRKVRQQPSQAFMKTAISAFSMLNPSFKIVYIFISICCHSLSHFDLSFLFWVERVAQAVSEQVKGKHGNHYKHTWICRKPWCVTYELSAA